MRERLAALVALVSMAIVGAPACGGGSSGAATRCLSDREICQFQVGVSTTADVKAALGNPQVTQSVASAGGGLQQWVYICQQSAQTVDVVQFAFDEKGVLFGFGTVRSGAGAPPAPTCDP